MEWRKSVEARKFTDARKKQGFRSQEHLDAFYAVYDHENACQECQTPGGVLVTWDCEYQTYKRCDVIKGLEKKLAAC